MIISFRRMFSEEPQVVIYFRGNGIHWREAASGGHHAGINGFQDIADEVEVVLDEDEAVVNEGVEPSDTGEDKFDGDKVFICEAEGIADAREDMSDEPEAVVEGVKAGMDLTALRFRSICVSV